MTCLVHPNSFDHFHLDSTLVKADPSWNFLFMNLKFLCSFSFNSFLYIRNPVFEIVLIVFHVIGYYRTYQD